MGARVSTIGMGTYYDPLWIASGYFGWRRGAADKIASLRKGLELGVTLIDTAEIYQSEALVRKAIAGWSRQDLFIATKVWPRHLRGDALIKACKKSLARLGTSYVDLYQVHWPNPSVPIRETMEAMEKLVDGGLIRGIGVSNFDLGQTRAANSALAKHRLSAVQLSYSLADREVENGILEYCDEEGIALLAYYPLDHGRLAKDPRLVEHSRKLGRSPPQVALNWLSRKRSVFPIPRASHQAHVEENVGAVDWDMGNETAAELGRQFPLTA